ncbi:transcriptional regulator [Blastopirellula marina]|uniref:Transcriptional regulator n=1 Tax=Blastopirellula marina TaxID=124 RepID=A0A2S8FEK6_9BACT|nr:MULTISPECIES: response regulator [Pirellulaceae]PQO30611.1 transcriptional regulator [Blastopirellula marina]RCS50748.1 response regulator [Bremerella cremea]
MAKRKLKTVILDDDAGIVRLVKTILRGAFGSELELVDFTNAQEAQNWIGSNCCDLLISDIEMPGIDGQDMLVFAKQRNAWTQVVFLTGQSSWMHVTQAVENGASDFLLKPIQRAELCNIVQQHIERAARWQSALFPKPIASAGV